jgi:hypothetical protein
MAQERPTFQDADLALKLYDLRREEVMRRSRDIMNGKFWPRSYEDFLAITKPEHEWNAAFRQVSSYWEMVYGIAKNGIAHADYLAENQGEGLFLFAKVKPHLERFRREVSPTAFQNAEWICTKTAEGSRRFELVQKRVQSMMQNR